MRDEILEIIGEALYNHDDDFGVAREAQKALDRKYRCKNHWLCIVGTNEGTNWDFFGWTTMKIAIKDLDSKKLVVCLLQS